MKNDKVDTPNEWSCRVCACVNYKVNTFFNEIATTSIDSLRRKCMHACSRKVM